MYTSGIHLPDGRATGFSLSALQSCFTWLFVTCVHESQPNKQADKTPETAEIQLVSDKLKLQIEIDTT